MVVGDADVAALEDALGRTLSVDEYAAGDFGPGSGRAGGEGPRRACDGPFASLADVRVAQRVGDLGAALGFPVELMSAREAALGRFTRRDAIVAGPRRANPWVELFEERLRFRSGFDEVTKRAWFDDVRPPGGEGHRYAADADRRGYCRVAYLSALGGSGSLVLLSGTEAPSTEAGLELLTRESRVAQLRARLALRPSDPVPHFEALLATDLVSSSTIGLELVALHVLDE
jgi:hypothetical protein